MITVEYIGDVSPTRVKIKQLVFNIKTGDIIELDEEHAEHLLVNKAFKKVSGSKKTEEKKEDLQEEEKESFHKFDLNDDGVVDEKDYSIAAKALSHARKNK